MEQPEKLLKKLESLHNKILDDKFAEQVTEEEISALVKAKEIVQNYMVDKIYVRYGQVLEILNKVPGYSFSQPRRNMRKIKELMMERNYDPDFVEVTNDHFREGFGIARDVLFDLITDLRVKRTHSANDPVKLLERVESLYKKLFNGTFSEKIATEEIAVLADVKEVIRFYLIDNTYISYGKIIRILNKVPWYSSSEPIMDMRKIKELTTRLEYDNDFVEAINHDFCKGFGTARNIIFNMLEEKFG